MARLFFLFLLAFEFAQSFLNVPTARASEVHALYVVVGTTLTTYDVNPRTGNAKQVGTPLNLGSGVASFPSLASSPDGHFLYVPCCINGTQSLSVYATDAKAVPQSPAIQVIGGNFVQVVIDPSGRFAYGVTIDQNHHHNHIFSVHTFAIDPASGTLTQLKIEHRYNEGTCCAWFNLDGFDSTGSRLYDDEGSDLGGGGGSLWYEQRVDAKTGGLGARVFLINGTYPGQGQYASVALGDQVILLSQTVNGDTGQSWLNVYPHTSNPQTPLIHCTTSMLDVCGNVYTLQLDPSQQNVFISISTQDPITIAQMNLAQGQLVATGGAVPGGQTAYFDPSGTLVYGLQFSNGSGTVSIYRFQAATGILTPGGQVSVTGNTFAPLIFTSARN